MSARYYNGAEGRRWLYQSEPTLRCPFDEGPPGWLADVFAMSDDAAVRSLDAAKVFASAHRLHRSHPFTDDGHCRACGAALVKVGYPAWAEEPWPPEKAIRREVAALARREGWDDERRLQAESSALSTRAINLRLGATHRRVPGSWRYFDKKAGREGSIAWAREQAQIDKAAVRADLERA